MHIHQTPFSGSLHPKRAVFMNSPRALEDDDSEGPVSIPLDDSNHSDFKLGPPIPPRQGEQIGTDDIGIVESVEIPDPRLPVQRAVQGLETEIHKEVTKIIAPNATYGSMIKLSPTPARDIAMQWDVHPYERKHYQRIRGLVNVLSQEEKIALEEEMNGEVGYIGDRFALFAVLGKGAFGKVFKAWDVKEKKIVALKLTLPATDSRRTLIARETEYSKHILRAQSPHLVTYLGRGKIGSPPSPRQQLKRSVEAIFHPSNRKNIADVAIAKPDGSIIRLDNVNESDLITCEGSTDTYSRTAMMKLLASPGVTATGIGELELKLERNKLILEALFDKERNTHTRSKVKFTHRKEGTSYQVNRLSKHGKITFQGDQHSARDRAGIQALLDDPEIKVIGVEKIEMHSESLYIVYEYYPNDLEKEATEIQNEPNALKTYTWLKRFSALAEAIAQIHSYGFMHKDIKESNVAITEAMELVLIDMGIAIDDRKLKSINRNQVIVGTPHRLAPEETDFNKKVTTSTDWHSFFQMVVFVLTGESLYYKKDEAPETIQELLDAIRHHSDKDASADIHEGNCKRVKQALLKHHVTANVADFILTMLEPSAEDRIDSEYVVSAFNIQLEEAAQYLSRQEEETDLIPADASLKRPLSQVEIDANTKRLQIIKGEKGLKAKAMNIVRGIFGRKKMKEEERNLDKVDVVKAIEDDVLCLDEHPLLFAGNNGRVWQVTNKVPDEESLFFDLQWEDLCSDPDCPEEKNIWLIVCQVSIKDGGLGEQRAIMSRELRNGPYQLLDHEKIWEMIPDDDTDDERDRESSKHKDQWGRISGEEPIPCGSSEFETEGFFIPEESSDEEIILPVSSPDIPMAATSKVEYHKVGDDLMAAADGGNISVFQDPAQHTATTSLNTYSHPQLFTEEPASGCGSLSDSLGSETGNTLEENIARQKTQTRVSINLAQEKRDRSTQVVDMKDLEKTGDKNREAAVDDIPLPDNTLPVPERPRPVPKLSTNPPQTNGFAAPTHTPVAPERIRKFGDKTTLDLEIRLLPQAAAKNERTGEGVTKGEDLDVDTLEKNLAIIISESQSLLQKRAIKAREIDDIQQFYKKMIEKLAKVKINQELIGCRLETEHAMATAIAELALIDRRLANIKQQLSKYQA